MGGITVTRTALGRRSGRPLVYSLAEAFVFVLIAAALVASAAVPAAMRHPHVAQAQTRTVALRP